MLAERGPNETIFYTNGKLIKHTVSEGSSLVLRSGDQGVLVRVVSILGRNHFAGIIYKFEPSSAAGRDGLQLDQRIEFCEKTSLV